MDRVHSLPSQGWRYRTESRSKVTDMGAATVPFTKRRDPNDVTERYRGRM